MKIVIATDSFKSALSAKDVCEIIADVIRQRVPEAEVIVRPMADGGEGTADALIGAADGRWIERVVTGPLPQMRVEAGFGWFDKDKTAVVEMAKASGIQLLTDEQLNPMKTTTYGTGELIREAIDYGAERIFLSIGGSATVDFGTGAAAALGWRFVDKDGNSVGLGGAGLKNITQIIKPDNFNRPPVLVLCDAHNVLYGPQGAAITYAPQKGATPEMVTILEDGIIHLSEVIAKTLNKDVADLPGAGAAGGLGAGAAAFFDAELVSGIAKIMEYTKLYESLENADWIVTGEGSFDEQSFYGKVISGIVKAARAKNVRIAVIAGQVTLTRDQYKQKGIEAAFACKDDEMSLDDAIKNTETLLKKAVNQFVDMCIIKK